MHPGWIVGGVAVAGLGALWLWSRSKPNAATLPSAIDIDLPDNLFDFALPGTCICVGGSFAERCRAIQQLVRPDEVQHVSSLLRSQGGRFVEHAAEYVARVIQYESDPLHCDRWCSPARTLFTRRGDCDDYGVTLAAILIAGDVDAAVVLGKTAGSTQGHVWVEGYDEHGAFFAEPQTGQVEAVRPSRYLAEHVLTLGYCTPCAA